jgi:hypothetical protein
MHSNMSSYMQLHLNLSSRIVLEQINNFNDKQKKEIEK